jgi:type I restriction enzyme M protein
LKNIFCSLADLKNEAAVESYFIDRLLQHLGYDDDEIKLKTNISEYEVGKGSKKSLYKPDYVILSSGVPTIVIDAKSPKENIDDWELQCSSYCLEINKEFDYNPVEFYLLSNGSKTALYRWDQKKPIIELDFSDFATGNTKLTELENKISKITISQVSEKLREELEFSDSKSYIKKYGSLKKRDPAHHFKN